MTQVTSYVRQTQKKKHSNRRISVTSYMWVSTCVMLFVYSHFSSKTYVAKCCHIHTYICSSTMYYVSTCIPRVNKNVSVTFEIQLLQQCTFPGIRGVYIPHTNKKMTPSEPLCIVVTFRAVMFLIFGYRKKVVPFLEKPITYITYKHVDVCP